MAEGLAMMLRRGGGVFDHPELGRVEVSVKSRARRFIARWDNERLKLTVPPGCSEADVMEALKNMTPRLSARKKVFRYTPGTVLRLEGLNITITEQSLSPDRVIVNWRLPDASLGVGTGLDFADPATTDTISRGLKMIAARVAPALLLPRAKEIAAAVGRQPAEWQISRGTHILGQCNAARRIKLSSALVFLPADLRDYVICHELAHLSELNHSPRFHQICDRYCGGRERELTARLRRFPWPILR